MIYLVIAILIAWGLLVALFEYLFGLSQETSVAIAASILGVAFIWFVWFVGFSRRGEAIARAERIKNIREAKIAEALEEYHDMLAEFEDEEILVYQHEREEYDKARTVSLWYSFAEGKYVREVDTCGEPYESSDGELIIPVGINLEDIDDKDDEGC